MEQIKKQIIKACRRLDLLGFVAATDGNVSARLDDGKILITPSMVSKNEIRESQLLVCNPDGKVLTGKQKASSEIKMHLYVYRMRPDIKAVVHAHPPVATGFATAGVSLINPVLPEAILTVGPVPLAQYATPSTDEIPRSIAPFVKKHNAILLSNHGALTFGQNITEALHRMERVEHLARVSLTAIQVGFPRKINKKNLKKLLKVI